MHAEIIAIGDELTSGQRLDTNSQWISQQLEQQGIRTLFHTTVGDDFEAMIDVFQISIRRAPLIVITGGLGPTADDLTRQAIAAATETELKLDPGVLEQISLMFTSRGRQMPAANKIQAMFPQGSEVISNPHGTAPGIDLQVSGNEQSVCRLFALPGVPAEMKQMWFETVEPRIQRFTQSQHVILHHRVKCFGAGESQLEGMLPDLIRRGREPRVGITVHQATITLRLTAAGDDRKACWQKMQPTISTIHECLGDLVFGTEDDELEHAVIRLLQTSHHSLAVCEWGTGGIVSQWLHAVPAENHPLKGATVLREQSSLQSLLEISPSASMVEDEATLVGLMAEAIRHRSQSDYGLAVGKLPVENDQTPRIYLGLSGPRGTDVQSRSFTGHPNILVDRAAKQALDLLRLHLISKNKELS
ncbi:MAG: CinA family nicotinamide mononucleotide deamidase-related protein [Planctomycetaceae bacterium]|nr:CinA family nicotinamide mononucleotide deamidase-related protein [Planctomycetaceae bacterium]